MCISWDGQASRRHAELTHHPDGWCLTDLASTNGTSVNGRRLTAGTSARLRVGDTFVIGTTTFTLVGARATAGAVSPSALTDIADARSLADVDQ